MNAPQSETRHRVRALLQDFDAVLTAEYEALRHRDSDGLESAVQRKLELTAQLEAVASELTPPAAGTPTTATDEAEWEQFRSLLGRCALANRTNGAAIDASRNFVTSLLDVLQGRLPGERIYNARGRLGENRPLSTFERV